jgi:serine/threonine-protein kinase RsbT
VIETSVPTMERRILRRLETAVSPPVARAVLRTACEIHGIDVERVSRGQLEKLGGVFVQALMRFGVEERDARRCSRRIVSLLNANSSLTPPAEKPIASETVIEIQEEYDIVRARGEGKALANALGFPTLMQVKIATAISELARNIVLYAGTGIIVVRALDRPRPGIEVAATDAGPGIAELDAVMSGSYRSRRGLGAGLRGTKKLMDEFEIDTGPGGTVVLIRKFLT